MSQKARLQLAAVAIRHAVARMGREVVRIHGRSMEPLLSHGDEVRVRAPDSWLPRRGSLVAVELAGAVAIHLVIDCDGQRVITQGLHAERPDPPAPVRALIGEVDAWRARGGTWRGMSWRIGIVLLALVGIRRRVGRVLRTVAG